MAVAPLLMPILTLDATPDGFSKNSRSLKCVTNLFKSNHFYTAKIFPIALLKQKTCSCLLDGQPYLGDRNACQGDREACSKKNSIIK